MSPGNPGKAPGVIAVVGAGTMGAGIAQLACATAGARTLLHDPVEEALQRGITGIQKRLERNVERERMSRRDADQALERLEATPDLAGLEDAELVIEAAPEKLELKREIFGRLSNEVVSEDCVLATNTSSLLVTAVAHGTNRPERVVGMHFFNPPPLMALLEVVAGEQSDEQALATARAAGEAMGKHVIDAVDGPGLSRQPLQPAVGARGAQAALRRRRHARGDRPHLPSGRGIPDGSVRADGPGRGRHGARHLALVLRAELRRAAMAARRRSASRPSPPAGSGASAAGAITTTARAPTAIGPATPTPLRQAAATASW